MAYWCFCFDRSRSLIKDLITFGQITIQVAVAVNKTNQGHAENRTRPFVVQFEFQFEFDLRELSSECRVKGGGESIFSAARRAVTSSHFVLSTTLSK